MHGVCDRKVSKIFGMEEAIPGPQRLYLDILGNAKGGANDAPSV